jgi:hypothetical protein
MSGPKPKPKPADKTAPTADKSESSNSPPGEKKSGRVSFDARGNAVWEWAMSTGIFGRDVDSERLKKLEAPDLKIADDPAPRGKSFGTPVDERGPGFDPYNTYSVKGAKPEPHKKDMGRDPYNTAGSVDKAKGERGGKPVDLKRLSEWIKRQRGLQKKDD